MKTPLLLLALVASPVSAFASQGVSNSLTECSALYTALLVKPAAVTAVASIDGARESAVAYLDRAMIEAIREGQASPATQVASNHSRLMRKWSPKVQSETARAETRDWLDYCNRFGTNLGLPTLP